jgi:hypothetical protein
MTTTLQLDISEDLVQLMGMNALQTYLQKQLESLKIQLLADKLGLAILQSGMNWEQEMENARQQAWNEYKQRKNLQ